MVLDALRSLQTVDLGHDQVHEHHTRMELIHLLDGFEAVAGLTDDLQAPCQLEDGAQALPHVLQIIDNQKLDLYHRSPFSALGAGTSPLAVAVSLIITQGGTVHIGRQMGSRLVG
jgi:hypothetical protein